MFKFIKQYAEKIDSVQVYPLISLLIFFIFFVVLIWYVVKLDKKSIQRVAGIPLDETSIEPNSQL